jgi:hypothetical protein
MHVVEHCELGHYGVQEQGIGAAPSNPRLVEAAWSRGSSCEEAEQGQQEVQSLLGLVVHI